MATCVYHYKGLLSRLKFNIDNRFAYLVMQKQSGDVIKEKEVNVVKK